MCDSCQAVRINGVLCHEQGCPDAWRDKEVECKWCGTMFKPEEKGQDCCDDDCFRAYNHLGDDCTDTNFDEEEYEDENEADFEEDDEDGETYPFFDREEESVEWEDPFNPLDEE